MEKLLLVDENDKVVGSREKKKCHKGKGILHRAFSIYVFNLKGELLIQRRSKQKPLWPLYWSNTCCSHPRKGETYVESGERRLQEEMGFTCALWSIDQFQYEAKYKDIGSENELLTILVGVYDGEVNSNTEEVNRWKWINLEKLKRDIERNPNLYAPWFKKGLKRYLKIKKKRDKEQENLENLLKEISKKTEPLSKKLLESYVEKSFHDLVNYQVSTGGKGLRSALTLISGRMMGIKEKDVIHPAAGIEILHNSTLITDDIIDHSNVRRGKSTVWKQYGQSVAECMIMDYVATFYLAANSSPEPQKIVEIYTKTLKTIVDGEILDILFEQGDRDNEPYVYKNRYREVSLESYFQMVSKKTAILFQSCCEIGGICAGVSKKNLKNLKEFGYNLGIAFQIQDDILDIFGNEKRFGKKIGKDIEEGKLGNIVIFYALQGLASTKREKVLKNLQKKNINNKSIKEAIEFIKQTNAHRKAFHLGERYVEKAKKSLEKLPQNQWNKYLNTLADFAIERKK